MAATTGTSSYLVDVATLTDSQSFLVTRIMVDKAVSTEDTELSEGSQVTKGSQHHLVGHCMGGQVATFPGKHSQKNSLALGIHDLPQQHRISLVNCLKEGTLTIRAVTNDAAHLRLTTSKDPVVIGDVPSACSMHSRGRRAFADGRIDRKGLPPSRAFYKPSATRTKNLIPPIASVKGGSSSSEYANSTGNEIHSEDEESQIAHSWIHFHAKPSLESLEPLEPPKDIAIC
ncbi:uncharacterized protein F5891DRAFT_977058 [Suillus fuscotomentosus]|uniref:Uncharacterized protein n=1 Tax=Suillus fuscotomentosus TaxID=1912939 RepID=A0AAD4HPG6_9AGAM|nr:uncharacterized protein F5891DRAFT_977058 [Suillus fuscotomentosus]KAG1904168.1 hypothetical protein F5891DRAFT_977058 [Suillus fuscotomentosus]